MKEDNGLKTMMIYESEWNNKKSFRMMPTKISCPFNEVLYDIENKVLAVIGKDKNTKIQMIPRINDKGQVIHFKYTDEKQVQHSKNKEERVFMEAYYEYYITNADDIKEFINTYSINPNNKALSVLKETKPKKDAKKS